MGASSRSATLGVSDYLLLSLLFMVVDEALALCGGASALAVTVYVSFCLKYLKKPWALGIFLTLCLSLLCN